MRHLLLALLAATIVGITTFGTNAAPAPFPKPQPKAETFIGEWYWTYNDEGGTGKPVWNTQLRADGTLFTYSSENSNGFQQSTYDGTWEYKDGVIITNEENINNRGHKYHNRFVVEKLRGGGYRAKHESNNREWFIKYHKR